MSASALACVQANEADNVPSKSQKLLSYNSIIVQQLT